MPGPPLYDRVRAHCAEVAKGARWVAIDPDATTAGGGVAGLDPSEHLLDGPPEDVARYVLVMDALNFGSGWFPTLRKPPGLSGFRTVEAGLRARGPWPAGHLTGIGTGEVAATFGQDPDHELMGRFAAALRELGQRVADDHGGAFLALARSGDGSAVALAETLAGWPGWRDVSEHDGEPVPFYKRAQIAAADLARQGIAPARDLASLTLFADNLVPHVLRLDGVLAVDPGLVARIDRGELLEHGSPEEVELRACAVHAVELLVAAHRSTTAAAVDNVLWNRGGGERYKATPRHRSRSTAY